MLALVDHMLALGSQLDAAKAERQRVATQRPARAVTAEIDCLVYDLYGLTRKEIALVEGAA
jgi:hypothetical protein